MKLKNVDHKQEFVSFAKYYITILCLLLRFCTLLEFYTIYERRLHSFSPLNFR